MLTKEEFIEKLSENIDFAHTHNAVRNLDRHVSWTPEEQKQLLDIAANCRQVYGTLDYQGNSRVGDFYRDILATYEGIQDENVDKVIKKILTIANEDIYNYLEEQKSLLLNTEPYNEESWSDEEHGIKLSTCDGLYHANSVSTSISFIKNKMLYSRQYGEDHFPSIQTEQDSDDTDKLDGIYNDLFFDNCDIPNHFQNPSPYGPVSFVFDERILLNSNATIRITKVNPGNNHKATRFGEDAYPERYFTSIEDLRKFESKSNVPFRAYTKYHTTFWNQSTLKLTPDILKYVLLEKKLDEKKNWDEEKTLKVKVRLEEELASAGLQNIPVILRPQLLEKSIKMTTSPNTLWKLPE